jgi:hypothetical protein
MIDSNATVSDIIRDCAVIDALAAAALLSGLSVFFTGAARARTLLAASCWAALCMPGSDLIWIFVRTTIQEGHPSMFFAAIMVYVPMTIMFAPTILAVGIMLARIDLPGSTKGRAAVVIPSIAAAWAGIIFFHYGLS